MNNFRDDKLTERVIHCILRVHRTLGPGFLEGVYRNALLLEFHKQNVAAEVEKEIIVHYDGTEVGRHRLDFLVEGQIILELKTVEALNKAHYAQVRSYLKATRLSVALLINFSDYHADVRRVEARVVSSPESPTNPHIS